MGKFLSVDPITQKYPMLSPYQFAGNRPIVAVDLDGLEPKDVNTGKTLPAPANNSNYKSWGDLLTMSNDFSVMEKANNRFIMHTFSQQPLSAASSDELNIDYYSIKINKLPPSYKTAESFFEAIRTNFADYMKGGGASLKPYNSDESVLWQSANPTSSIMTFRIKPQLGGLTSLDDADVITENIQKRICIGYLNLFMMLRHWHHQMLGIQYLVSVNLVLRKMMMDLTLFMREEQTDQPTGWIQK